MQQKLSSVKITIALLQKVSAPCGFLCLRMWLVQWHPPKKTLTFCMASFRVKCATVQLSLSENWKLTDGKITIASPQKVLEPCCFFFVLACWMDAAVAMAPSLELNFRFGGLQSKPDFSIVGTVLSSLFMLTFEICLIMIFVFMLMLLLLLLFT